MHPRFMIHEAFVMEIKNLQNGFLLFDRNVQTELLKAVEDRDRIAGLIIVPSESSAEAIAEMEFGTDTVLDNDIDLSFLQQPISTTDSDVQE